MKTHWTVYGIDLVGPINMFVAYFWHKEGFLVSDSLESLAKSVPACRYPLIRPEVRFWATSWADAKAQYEEKA